MLGFIFILLYYLLANGFFVVVFKKTFGKCLPLTFIINAFVYFLSQMLFNTFKVGFVINLLFALLFAIYLIALIIKKKDLQFIKKNYLSSGFYSFITIYVLVIIYNFNRVFDRWDELSHWGKMVKEMFRLDSFYSIESSTLLVHKDYPPIISLLELFFCHLFGNFNESCISCSLHLFNLSLLVPILFDEKNNISKIKVVLKTILISLCAFIVILFFDQRVIIQSIYIDYTIAILTAYLLFQVIIEKDLFSNFHICNLILAGSFLVLTKENIVALYVMVAFFYLVNIFVREKINVLKLKDTFHKIKTNGYKNFIIKVVKVILVILAPLLIWKGWNYYIESINAPQYNLSNMKILEMYNIIKGKSGEEYQQEAANNFFSAIKSKSLTTSKILPLSYFQLVILSFILLFFIAKCKKAIINKKELYLSYLTLTIGAFGYAFMMLAAYMFYFGSYDGPNLGSFDRYMMTFPLLCFIYAFLIYMYSNVNNDSKFFENNICFLLIILLLQNPTELYRAIPKIFSRNDTYAAYRDSANFINEKTPKDSKIFVISQKGAVGDLQFLNYYLDGRQINYSKYYFPCDIKNVKNNFIKNIKPFLIDYDYLYIYYIDENFINNYEFLFKDIDVSNDQLYKINNKEEFSLQLVD